MRKNQTKRILKEKIKIKLLTKNEWNIIYKFRFEIEGNEKENWNLYHVFTSFEEEGDGEGGRKNEKRNKNKFD